MAFSKECITEACVPFLGHQSIAESGQHGWYVDGWSKRAELA